MQFLSINITIMQIKNAGLTDINTYERQDFFLNHDAKNSEFDIMYMYFKNSTIC